MGGGNHEDVIEGAHEGACVVVVFLPLQLHAERKSTLGFFSCERSMSYEHRCGGVKNMVSVIPRGRACKAGVHDLFGQADGFEHLSPFVGLQRGDAHFAHDLKGRESRQK